MTIPKMSCPDLPKKSAHIEDRRKNQGGIGMKNIFSMRQCSLSGVICLLFILSLFVPANAAGIYQTEPRTGCRMWNPEPEPKDSFSWNGECKDGYLEGFGIAQYFADGNPVGKYEGNFVKGKRSGKGVATWTNGNRYEGDWLDDNMHGKGLMTSTSGASYNGDWVRDKMQGYGVYLWPDGMRYEGNWVDGYMHGNGVLKSPDGQEMRGRFEKDKYLGP